MPPPASDFLGGQPACPSTPVPGHWLVDLPSSSSTIFIRRYRPLAHEEAAEAVEGLKRGNGDTLLGRLGEDALEEGWRAVNGSGPSSTGDVDKVLRGGCGVIVRTEPESEGDGGSKSQGRRELWCFYATESEAMIPRDTLQGEYKPSSINKDNQEQDQRTRTALNGGLTCHSGSPSLVHLHFSIHLLHAAWSRPGVSHSVEWRSRRVRRYLLDIFGRRAALGVLYRCGGGEVGMAHGSEVVDAPQT